MACTVAFALVGVVLWGSLVGSVLPFALRRLGFDPATSSAPFVATLVDVTGLIIYFSVGLLVLRGTLLRRVSLSRTSPGQQRSVAREEPRCRCEMDTPHVSPVLG